MASYSRDHRDSHLPRRRYYPLLIERQLYLEASWYGAFYYPLSTSTPTDEQQTYTLHMLGVHGGALVLPPNGHGQHERRIGRRYAAPDSVLLPSEDD